MSVNKFTQTLFRNAVSVEQGNVHTAGFSGMKQNPSHGNIKASFFLLTEITGSKKYCLPQSKDKIDY